ncbi:Pyridoxine/pyridoxamine 5'-phosphate oxidase 2-like protein, partial [Drosera capensis]
IHGNGNTLKVQSSPVQSSQQQVRLGCRFATRHHRNSNNDADGDLERGGAMEAPCAQVTGVQFSSQKLILLPTRTPIRFYLTHYFLPISCFSDVVLIESVVSGDFRIEWKTCESHRRFQRVSRYDSDRILINTDSRTHKIEDLKHYPFAEQREKSWFASSLKSRLQYLGPYPGLPSIGDGPPSNLTLDPSSAPVVAF